LNVKFILINREFYSPEDFEALMKEVNASNQFWPPRTFGEGGQQVVVVEPKP
jgi:hypothetical protein